MNEIVITPMSPGRYRVQVQESGDLATSHVVTVPDAFLEEYGAASDGERVVRESFAFLLEREPASSIMREFELPVISRFFGEYPDELRRRLT